MVIDNDEAVIGQRQYLVKDVFVSFVLIYFCYALSSFLFILARFFAVLLKFSVWGLDSSFRDLILFLEKVFSVWKQDSPIGNTFLLLET